MNYYNEIKKELVNNEIYKKVKEYSKNKSDLSTYYNVGQLLIEAQGEEERAKYGDGLKEYSDRLTEELGKGYTFTNLTRMRRFYLIQKKVATVSQQLTWSHYVELLRKFYLFQKGQTLSTNLVWSHYVELLKFDDINKINYYISITEQNNLSVRELRLKIKNEEYERLDESTKNKLITKEKNKIEDFIKNPIIIKNNHNYDIVSERVLKQLILEDIDNFLLELGEGFTYIRNEYKIKLGDQYNYIDRNLRKFNQKNTIGIIIVKKDNKFIMEYCSDDRIFRTSYILN